MAGTSNWQHISYCVDVLMKIAPARVLDIGCGFGRWGMLTREFGELWQGRVFPDQWSLQVDAIEGFAKNICEYHKYFYNNIRIGDAAELATDDVLQQYDLVIMGDMLEHLERKAGEALLERAIRNAVYVLVNVPLGGGWEQDESYGNQFERHLAVWNFVDFDRPERRHYRLFRDSIGRPHAVFVISKNDPKDLQAGLFSCYEGPAGELDEVGQLTVALQNMKNELDTIQKSRAWKLLHKLRTSAGWRAVRKVRRRLGG
jgi:SAM-dependent methyltransferase